MTSVRDNEPFSKARFDNKELESAIHILLAKIQKLEPSIVEPGVIPYAFNKGAKRQVLIFEQGRKQLEVHITPTDWWWSFFLDYDPWDQFGPNVTAHGKASGGLDALIPYLGHFKSALTDRTS